MLLFRTIISFLREKAYQDLLVTTSIIIGIGSTAYHYIEGWSWIDSVYFSIITLTTIGYGDFSPQTTEGKLFTIFYILIGIGIILGFVNAVHSHYTSIRKKRSDLKKD